MSTQRELKAILAELRAILIYKFAPIIANGEVCKAVKCSNIMPPEKIGEFICQLSEKPRKDGDYCPQALINADEVIAKIVDIFKLEVINEKFS